VLLSGQLELPSVKGSCRKCVGNHVSPYHISLHIRIERYQISLKLEQSQHLKTARYRNIALNPRVYNELKTYGKFDMSFSDIILDPSKKSSSTILHQKAKGE
jgi:hypothetical protein